MYFLRETSFDSFELETPIENIADRITELYMHLIRKYMDLGLDFMKSFYSTENKALSGYMGEVDGKFDPGTVMDRSEKEMNEALTAGVIRSDTDIHIVCLDICTIVKGCVFEWCLTDGSTDIQACLKRLIQHYMQCYLLN